MSLVVVVLAAALGLGRLLGGRLAGLGALQLRAARLLLVAVGLQLVGALLGGAAYGAGLALSTVTMLVFLASNRRVRGLGLVGLGLGCNALVVGLNGGMPVSVPAAARADVSLVAVTDGLDPRHELMGPGTRLRLLGDVVPVPLPVRPEVVSPGDVLVAAGLGQLVLVAVLAGRPVRSRRARRPGSARRAVAPRKVGRPERATARTGR